MWHAGGSAAYWALRLVGAFVLVYVLAPRLLFSGKMWADSWEAFWGPWVLALAVNILVIYVLAAIRLYEVVSVAVVYAAIWYRRYLRHKSQVVEDPTQVSDLFELLDGNPRAKHKLITYCRTKFTAACRFMSGFVADPATVILSITFLLVFGLSAYIRFYDSLVNIAPAMSDSYVTLAWMKYINNRMVFHDGIYPQGFHIYLSTLAKASRIDPLLVLRFTGPLNSVMTVYGTYFAGRKLSGQVTGGLAAAFAYGLLTNAMPYEFQRQAATNSQEFAMIFLCPALVYTWEYLSTGRRAALVIAFGSLTVTGLVHSMVALFTGLSMAAALVAGVLVGAGWRRTFTVAGAGFAAAIISVIPLGIGYLVGVPLHESSAAFATGTWVWYPPLLDPPMAVALVLPVLALVPVVVFRQWRDIGPRLVVLFLMGGAYLVYQAPRLGIHNVALMVRSGGFVAVAMAIALGVGWGTYVRLTAQATRWQALGRTVAAACTLLAAIWATRVAAPQPAMPYKMQYNSSVQQYMRISRSYLPTSWLMISDEEGYALAFGVSWHLMLGDFLDHVSPTSPRLVYEHPERSEELDYEAVFIFHERVPYDVPVDMARALIPRRIEEERRLLEWIEAYSAVHDNIQVFYEDEDIVVWLITQSKERVWPGWGP